MNDRTELRTELRTDLRDGLIAGLLAARATEREIFEALGPTVRDARATDGGWSPKDIQALPEQEELRSFAPGDDDLIALRHEIPSLIEG